MARMPLRGLGWMENGRDGYMKTMETASRLGMRLGCGGGDTPDISGRHPPSAVNHFPMPSLERSDTPDDSCGLEFLQMPIDAISRQTAFSGQFPYADGGAFVNQTDNFLGCFSCSFFRSLFRSFLRSYFRSSALVALACLRLARLRGSRFDGAREANRHRATAHGNPWRRNTGLGATGKDAGQARPPLFDDSHLGEDGRLVLRR